MHNSNMTVRGGKNRVLVFTGAGLLIVALLLVYHNAATRLDDARSRYEKCHHNEESLGAQLQVILEYKTRLEKSLQQEKSDHSQTKEDMRNKAEQERQTRERENLEIINKFTALQQQYKLLQSQHEDVILELEKAKQQLLASDDERTRLEGQISSLTQQNKLLKEGRQSDAILLQGKISKLEADNMNLKKEGNIELLVKEKEDLRRELTDCLRHGSSTTVGKKAAEEAANPEDTLGAPVMQKALKVTPSSSTPQINPDALLSQEKLAAGAPVSAPKLSNFPVVQEFKNQHIVQEEQELNRARPQIPEPVVREIPRNNYKEYEDEHKEEDDDDGDPNQYLGDKELEPARAPPKAPLIPIPHDHNGVQVNPK